MRNKRDGKKRIAICRLRQNVIYTVPLTTILDSFYECLLNFRDRHEEYEYSYHKFSFSPFSKDKPQENAEALAKADVIIIPTEAEFTYWISGKLHTLSVRRSQAALEKIKGAFRNKRIILLRSDRADSVELYREATLKGIKADYKVIDEDDFPLGIHGMKYHFIKHETRYLDRSHRPIDFAYWGSDKRKLPHGKPSGDERHLVLKSLAKSNIETLFWGNVGVGGHQKWNNDFRVVVRSLVEARSTLCFNWLDSNAVTARYGEALACGVMPFVWRDYDKQGKLVSDDWLRIQEPEELLKKLESRSFEKKLKAAISAYERNLPSLADYIDLFEKKLLALL